MLPKAILLPSPLFPICLHVSSEWRMKEPPGYYVSSIWCSIWHLTLLPDMYHFRSEPKSVWQLSTFKNSFTNNIFSFSEKIFFLSFLFFFVFLDSKLQEKSWRKTMRSRRGVESERKKRKQTVTKTSPEFTSSKANMWLLLL